MNGISSDIMDYGKFFIFILLSDLYVETTILDLLEIFENKLLH